MTNTQAILLASALVFIGGAILAVGGDDRAGHLIHRLERCLAWCQALLVHDPFGVLDDDDRIIRVLLSQGFRS